MSSACNRRTRSGKAVSLLVPLIVALAACESSGGESDAGSKPKAPSTLQSTPSPTPSADAGSVQALAAYRAMWQAMVDAGRTADYRSPALGRHATGQAQALLVSGLYDAHRQGVVIKGEPKMQPKVTALKPAETSQAAEIVDCLDARNWLNFKRSGDLRDQTPGGRHRVTATVGHLSSGWKVTRLRVQDVGTC
jgi:hypothetical protein